MIRKVFVTVMPCTHYDGRVVLLNNFVVLPQANVSLGHMSTVLGRKLGTKVPTTSIIMMTVLRHPVGRFLSEYSWVTKGIPNSCASSGKRQRYAWDYVLPCNMSLSSFMQQEPGSTLGILL